MMAMMMIVVLTLLDGIAVVVRGMMMQPDKAAAGVSQSCFYFVIERPSYLCAYIGFVCVYDVVGGVHS